MTARIRAVRRNFPARLATVPHVADDDTGLRPIEGGAPGGLPVFGRRATPLEARRYRRFGMEVESDSERWIEEFECYFDPDAGAILGLMNARTEWQQANSTAVLLGTSLRDDDGVPASWSFPVEPRYDDDGETVVDDAGSPLYEWHDGSLLTEEELRAAIREFDPLDEGSSRRRFSYVMDSPNMRVQLSALTELADWVIGDAAKRPPRRPTSSARGQSRTSRTSGARRH